MDSDHWTTRFLLSLETISAGGVALAFVLGGQMSGRYSEKRLRSLNRGFAREPFDWMVVIGGLVFFGFALKVSADFSRVWLVGHALSRLAVNGLVRERIAIYGCGERGALLTRHLTERDDPQVISPISNAGRLRSTSGSFS